MKKLIIASIIAFASTTTFASVTRSCSWSVSVNNVAKMAGSVNGTAGTVFIARKEASKNALACFDKSTALPYATSYCPTTSGWNKSFFSIFPKPAGKYTYTVNVSGDNGSGCTGTKSYTVYKF